MKYESNLINLEINRPFLPPITAKQNDTARYLLFNILDNGVPFNLANKTVRAYVENGANPNYDNLTTIDAEKGLCELKLSTSMLNSYGDKFAELTITEGMDTVSTMPFTLRIVKSVKNDGAIQATNEFSALTVALNQVEVWNTYFENTNGQLEVKYTTRLTALEGEIRDTKATTLSTNANLTSLTGVVDGLLNIDKVQGKTLVNLSKFTTVSTSIGYGYSLNSQASYSLGRTITIINPTGRKINVEAYVNGTKSRDIVLKFDSAIYNATLNSDETVGAISYENQYGWTDSNKNDLLKVMILDGTVNFMPSYFEGIKSVGEDNNNKIEISSYKPLLRVSQTAFIDSKIFTLQVVNTYDTKVGDILCWILSDGKSVYGTNIKVIGINGNQITLDFGSSPNVTFTSTEGLRNETVKDKSEILLSGPLSEWNWIDRAKNTVCKKSKPFIMDGNVTYIGNATANTFATIFYFNVDDLGEGVIKCKELPSWSTFIYGDNLGKYEGIYSAGGHIYFAIANSKTGITTNDGYDTQIVKIKAYLTNNPINIVYQTATETTEPITSKLSLNSYANGYLQLSSGAINPSVDVSYPTNIGERTKVAEDSILSLFNKLKTILPSQIVEDTLHRFITDTEKTKLSGIEANANNYTHPATHLASIINLTQGGNLQTWVNNFTVQDCGNEYYILKFPGFQIHVSWNAVLQSTGVKHVNFYNAFASKCFGVITTCSYSLTGACKPGYISNVSTTGFDLAIWDNASSGVDIAYYWIAIGR